MRLKEARERVGLDQLEAARRIGVKVHVLSNVEKCRAPLRADLALRFCRELFVNEEWLATGRVALLNAALQAVMEKALNAELWEPVFFRTPLNLRLDPVTAAIPHRALFSAAFSTHLKSVAAELSKGTWLQPPMPFTSYDRPEYRAEFLSVLVDRWRTIIRFRAEEMGLTEDGQRLVEADLVANLTKAGMVIFNRSCGIATPFQSGPAFDFLRVLVSDDKTPIGTLSGVHEVTLARGKDGELTVAAAKPVQKRK